MYYEIAADFTGKLQDYTPSAAVTDRSAWENLLPEWRKESVHLGEFFLKYTYPSLSAIDYMDFTRTGNRIRYEDKFFARRQALSALVLAECAEDKQRFLDDIVNGIFAICEESGWQLPAHNSYIRDTPQLPLPDVARPVLDLFSCETGAVLATACYLLRDRLDAFSPSVVRRIHHELNHRIFRPYLDEHFWWMGDGIQPMNNWTIWCTQNILLSVFMTDTDQRLRKQVLLNACQSVDYFLNEYGSDGCCDEGAQYYRHAGLCLFHVTELLNAVTDQAFISLYKEPKIQNIASYILHVHVAGKYYINFADCSPIAGRAGTREFLFAERTHNTNMMRFAAEDFIAGGKDTLLLSSENNLFYRLLNGFTARRIIKYASIHKENILYPDLFYQSVGLFIARDDTLCLAVKAGDNADSHNHNDTGSFTVYKNGSPLLIDVGVENYTQKTFSQKRYEIWTMQSAYHNLPTVNGIMQSDGDSYRATNVSFHMSDTLCEISMDIAHAYSGESGLSSYRRTATLHKKSKIVIRDCFAFVKDTASDGQKNTVVLSLMSYETPVIQTTAQALLLQLGELGTLAITNASLLAIERIPITDSRLKLAWDHDLYRILVNADQQEIEIQIY
ncbi:MAG: heparinase II/III-family protein [Lachnospiraceae bacterium]|nr:heparinase II/III-family protein [Lachnospiraceae bacterium]